MNHSSVSIDLAKNVFEVAVGTEHRITQHHRLTRKQFEQFGAQLPLSTVVMEACGTAHHWGRRFTQLGHVVRLLPAHDVRRYRKRNKTDRADTSAIFNANRDSEILPVPIKTEEQQAIQLLHRIRSGWMSTRTSRINTLRGMLREFGICIPEGAKNALRDARAALDSDTLPKLILPAMRDMLDEIGEIEKRILSIEDQLGEYAQSQAIVQRLQTIPGIGLLTSTALLAAIGSVAHFRNGRHLASWLGLTPREHSSGETRHLGRISKKGDRYLRVLLTHGARSVINAARAAQKAGRPLDRLRQWALGLADRRGHNKATVALANKLARIAWATWHHQHDYDQSFQPVLSLKEGT